MKTTVGRLLTGVVALALLLGGFGLMQDTAQAQKAVTTESPPIYICTDRDCDLAGTDTPSATDHDNVFTVAFTGADADNPIIIQNLDLPTVSDALNADDERGRLGSDANPKHIPVSNATIVAVHQSSDLMDDGTTYQVKAFNGNRIQVTFTPEGGQFATIKRVIVDNVKPQVVTTSPDIPLIVTSGVDLVFSADITDGGSGYTTKVGTSAATDIDDLDNASANASLPLTIDDRSSDPTNVTPHGGIRLVVAGNNVALNAGDFEELDDGWRVTKTINSSAIQNIAPNIPWYFVTKDRAGNTRRTSGSIAGSTAGPTTGEETVTITDGKYVGALNGASFAESSVRVTRNDANGNPVLSNAQPITGFDSLSGKFTFRNTAADPLFGPPEREADSSADPPVTARPYLCPFDPRDSDPYEAPPDGIPTDDDYKLNDGIEDVASEETAHLALCNAPAKSKYEILGSNVITVDSEEPELTSTETGIGYDSGKKDDKVQKNSIKLVFSDLGSDESSAPGSGLDAASVTPAAFTVAGNTVESVTVAGNKVYLTLADNLGSTERPAVSINSGVVMDKAGNAFGGERVPKAIDRLGPNLSLSKDADLSNDKVTVTITTDEQLNASPTVTVNMATSSDGDVESNAAVPTSAVRQAGSLSFTYAHSNSTGGEFSVHVMGADTGENSSSVGDQKSASSSKAFTFELDKRLNKGMAPAVMVADKTPVDAMGVSTTKLEEVEVTSPLNITVDFSQEGKEYARDSYKTITLTKATLKVTADDGTSETTTFDIATDVNSPDSVKFTISVLNPAVGAYQLTVQAMDEAGNVRTDGTGTTAENLVSKWKVIPARPFSIDLAVGWNQISMPFHPANPAINSVIAIDHPITTVLTYDNIEKVWLFSTRNAETGLFEGDVSVMTADTAYFVLTTNFTPLKLLRPPLTSGLAGPPVPLAITVLEGWNLVPVITNSTPSPVGIAADAYFGSLGTGATAGWLRALTFNPTSQGWDSVTPGGTLTLKPGDTNPCTGKELDVDKVLDGTEPCQVGEYTDRSRAVNDIEVGDEVDGEVVDEASYGDDGKDGAFDANDRVVIQEPVIVGKGYWIYVTVEEGAITPR